MATGKNTREALTRSQRRVQAWTLRMSGLTFAEIGSDMGITAQASYKLVKKEIDAYRIQHIEEIENARTLEAERLDALTAGLWKKAVSGHHGAINCMLKIMERRAKMLGLDGPIKIAPTAPAGDKPYDGTATTAELLSRLDRIIATEGKETGGQKVDAIGG